MQFLIIACALLGVALGQTTISPVYQGYPGYQGYRGYQGYQGYPGYQGYQGYQGYRGYQGYQGYQGYPGYQGYRGYQGFPGVAVTPKPSVAPIAPVSIVPGAVKAVYNYGSASNARILSQEQDSSPDGSYNWRFQTENGISAAESGVERIAPNGESDKVVVGEYYYTAPNGEPIYVRYTADRNGFHPETVSAKNYAGRSLDGIDGIVPLTPVAKAASEVPEKKEK